MSNLNPEVLLYNKLVQIFPPVQIAPSGESVYHSVPGVDPVAPYVLYRRNSSENERDIQGNMVSQKIELIVKVASMFFQNTLITMPDNFTDNSTGLVWYFTLEDQSQDVENYDMSFSYIAFTNS